MKHLQVQFPLFLLCLFFLHKNMVSECQKMSVQHTTNWQQLILTWKTWKRHRKSDTTHLYDVREIFKSFVCDSPQIAWSQYSWSIILTSWWCNHSPFIYLNLTQPLLITRPQHSVPALSVWAMPGEQHHCSLSHQVFNIGFHICVRGTQVQWGVSYAQHTDQE